MHSHTSFTLLTLTALVASAHAFALPKRQDGAPRVVSMRTRRTSNIVRLARRENTNGTAMVKVSNQNLLYTVEAKVGTPPQDMILQLDTGSADLWVPATAWCKANTTTADGDPCTGFGSYAANDSSTYEYLNSDLMIGYVDNSETAGDFAKDKFTIGDVSVDDMQIGIGYDIQGNSFTGGILGVSYTRDESGAIEGHPDAVYPNFPAVLAQYGLIQSVAYSLWLNSGDSGEGSILFGGIDTERFEGDLKTVPVIQTNGTYRDLQITLNSVTIDGTALGGSTDNNLTALLDSGTTYTYIPDNMVEQLYKMLPAEFDSKTGNAFVECTLREKNLNVTFNFSGVEIVVPISELVLDAETYAHESADASVAGACAFGILPQGAMALDAPILGDTFLRSAYVVYDLENNEISLAQARWDSRGSNILEIGSGKGAVPSATPAGSSPSPSGGTPNNNNDNAAVGVVPITHVTWLVAAVFGLAMLA